jgi:ATP-dependent DNA helicase Rep/DNA helicase-2/ATP-dependent DNA helicase PcrA
MRRHPLNRAQAEAVSATEGPVLVLAGAGTGKTRVITYRIARLLEKGVPPDSILAVTFTNKAAREMRERVGEILGRRPKGLTLSTFHALGARILRAEAGEIGYRSDFSIYDASDQLSVVRSVLGEIRPAALMGPPSVLAAISRAKNRFASPEDLAGTAADDEEHLVAAAYARYQAALRSMSCVDFDDLIYLPVGLLESRPDIAGRYRVRFRYILVDEYQDTNGAQYRFLRSIVGPSRNLCVVGDDDQSIYAFRGADVAKILGFERDFPGARVVKLEENYRSTGSILDLANAVIAASPRRHEKRLRSKLGPGDPVRWVVAPDQDREVDFIVGEVKELIRSHAASPGSIAILIRAVHQARPFEEKLRLRGVPYTLVGGQSYFDRKEIRDVLAYWMAAANPLDEMSLLRIINVPARGFGPAAIEKLRELARSRRTALGDALEAASSPESGLPEPARRAAGRLAALFAEARERLRSRDFAGFARGVLEDAGYEDAVKALYPDPLEARSRWKAVEELLASVAAWQAEHPGRAFADFLEAVALDDDTRRDDERKPRGLLLMTLHGAKGLEFPHVFLAGVEEDILPHRRAIEEGDHAIEEERRLFYVGITRARRTLTLTQAFSRRTHGKEHLTLPSRFLAGAAEAGLVEKTTYDPHARATEADVEGFIEDYRRRRAETREAP